MSFDPSGHFAGNLAYYSWNGVEIPDVRDFSVDRTADTAEVTAGRDADKDYVVTQKDASGNITTVYSGTAAAGTAIYQTMYAGAIGTLAWGPIGTDAGLPKNECVAIITSVGAPIGYSSELTQDRGWQRKGAWINNEDDGDTW